MVELVCLVEVYVYREVVIILTTVINLVCWILLWGPTPPNYCISKHNCLMIWPGSGYFKISEVLLLLLFCNVGCFGAIWAHVRLIPHLFP